MAETKTKVGDAEIKAVIDSKYSKKQILRSKKYRDQRDLINALLEDGISYSLKDVDSRIYKFLKGGVK